MRLLRQRSRADATGSAGVVIPSLKTENPWKLARDCCSQIIICLAAAPTACEGELPGSTINRSARRLDDRFGSRLAVNVVAAVARMRADRPAFWRLRLL